MLGRGSSASLRAISQADGITLLAPDVDRVEPGMHLAPYEYSDRPRHSAGLSRRDPCRDAPRQTRVVIDGMTAANDPGLTTAVPARIEVLVDARLKPIRLGTQEIHFKYAAPSRLYWRIGRECGSSRRCIGCRIVESKRGR